MNKITQKQFDEIYDLLVQMQKVCEDVNTSSVNVWLTFQEIEENSEN